MTTITQKHKNMKSTILTIMLAALTMGAAAQSKDSTCVRKDSVRIFSDPESSPHFRGGKEGLMQFLKKKALNSRDDKNIRSIRSYQYVTRKPPLYPEAQYGSKIVPVAELARYGRQPDSYYP